MYQVVLRNAQRGEAVLGEPQPLMQGRNLLLGDAFLSLQMTPAAVAFSDVVERFPSRGMAPLPQIDRAWLDGADLVVLENAYAGRITRPLTIEAFRIRP